MNQLCETVEVVHPIVPGNPTGHVTKNKDDVLPTDVIWSPQNDKSDANGMTKAEICAALDKRKVAYPAGANKDQLLKLLQDGEAKGT